MEWDKREKKLEHRWTQHKEKKERKNEHFLEK